MKFLVYNFFVLALLCSPNIIFGGKLPVYAKNGMVVSTSKIASTVGRDVLADGGNAIDAAVATAFALAVTWPSAGNIGGGGFIVYHSHDGAVNTIDFREKAPLAATRDMYLDKNGVICNDSNHTGILSVGVPGTVAGLYKAHQLYGKKSWHELIQPAINLAKNGFPFTWALHEDTKNVHPRNRLDYPSLQKVFYKKNGDLYKPGEIWKQPDLAKTLARIQQNGHDGFYRGDTAKKLADFMHNNGGLITIEDLENYQAVIREPVHNTYRGYDIYSMPPPSSGGTALLEMLNVLEGYDLKSYGHNSAQYLHILTESMRRAYADRAQFSGDPDFNSNLSVDKLISKEYAKKLRQTINLEHASKSDSATFNNAYESEETTHLSVVDSQGNAVSLTYTLEYSYGSGIVAEGLGFLLNNEMGDFNAVPGLTNSRGTIGTQPNQIEPQKRMLSSMTPTIVAKNSKPLLVLGSPGGRTIINTVLQVILNVIDFNMNISQAVEEGRIHHQWLPDVTSFEEWAISSDTAKLYKNMGHGISYRAFQGRVMAIFIDPGSGLLHGAADSRSPDGEAVGY